MEHDYRNIISHIDIDRSLGAIEYSSFNGIEDESILEFKDDTEAGNDSIELHLIKSKAYREVIILRLKKSNGAYADTWRDFLRKSKKHSEEARYSTSTATAASCWCFHCPMK